MEPAGRVPCRIFPALHRRARVRRIASQRTASRAFAASASSAPSVRSGVTTDRLRRRDRADSCGIHDGGAAAGEPGAMEPRTGCARESSRRARRRRGRRCGRRGRDAPRRTCRARAPPLPAGAGSPSPGEARSSRRAGTARRCPEAPAGTPGLRAAPRARTAARARLGGCARPHRVPGSARRSPPGRCRAGPDRRRLSGRRTDPRPRPAPLRTSTTHARARATRTRDPFAARPTRTVRPAALHRVEPAAPAQHRAFPVRDLEAHQQMGRQHTPQPHWRPRVARNGYAARVVEEPGERLVQRPVPEPRPGDELPSQAGQRHHRPANILGRARKSASTFSSSIPGTSHSNRPGSRCTSTSCGIVTVSPSWSSPGANR